MNKLKAFGYWRLFRIIFGAIALFQALIMRDIILGIGGIVVAGMAILNMGCCGVNGCNTSFNSKNNKKIDHIEYEEVVAEK